MPLSDLHPEMHGEAGKAELAKTTPPPEPNAPGTFSQAGEEGTQEPAFEELVALCVQENASDLHLTVGYNPVIRVTGSLVPLTKYRKLTREDNEKAIKTLLSKEQWDAFQVNREIDFSYSFQSTSRFRGNGSYERGNISIALRHIPNKIHTIEELGLPSILNEFTLQRQGFFLVVGPVGQGKSTTLAAMIERINQTRAERIVTIEDPIEYLFEPKESVIIQREAQVDTENFHVALRSSLRQDVNVIMVGEMRSTETIASGVTASETGHLVFSTLHTNNAAQTIDRIIDSFPGTQQDQIRMQLSTSLAGIFSQRLVPRISGGLVPAYELLINTKAVANLIRERRTHEINSIIETSSEDGMVTINQSLAELIRKGEITVEQAIHTTIDPKDLERLL